MKCKFCNQEKKLIKAHIVPEAFFRAMKSSSKSPVLVDDSPGTYPRKRPIGVYDKNMVCLECESLWGEWDDYGQKIILGIEGRKVINKGGSIIADVVENINYKKLKLFFISILWRASVSENDFFSKVKLGPFERKCKKMILESDPGTANEFSVYVARYPDPAGQVIAEPFPERLSGVNHYRFSFAGHTASIKVDQRNSVGYLNKLVLREGEPLIIPHKDIYESAEGELLSKVIGKVKFS